MDKTKKGKGKGKKKNKERKKERNKRKKRTKEIIMNDEWMMNDDDPKTFFKFAETLHA